MSAGDVMGWLAAALTLLAFLMRSMTALRIVAIAANLCFILYGAMSWAYPVLVLHIALLPCNVLRLCELWRGDAERAAPRRL
jgi:uncharacterized membrane protein